MAERPLLRTLHSPAMSTPCGGGRISAGQWRVMLLLAGASAALIAPVAAAPAPRLLWNASDSVPVGLYLIAPGQAARSGDLAVVRLSGSVRVLAARRHYLPANVALLKPVIAAAGARVCATGSRILIDDRPAAARLPRDSAGRALPWWNGCRTLGTGEVFLIGTRRPDSFDSRYFGPVSRAAILGTARPLWLR